MCSLTLMETKQLRGKPVPPEFCRPLGEVIVAVANGDQRMLRNTVRMFEERLVDTGLVGSSFGAALRQQVADAGGVL